MNSPNLPLLDLTLWYETTKVGHIRDAFCSDDTWYGTLDRTITGDNPLVIRLIEFIMFCEKWDKAGTDNPNNPPDAAEFDRFTDIIKSGLWFIETNEGMKQPIIEAPFFRLGGQLSWRSN